MALSIIQTAVDAAVKSERSVSYDKRVIVEAEAKRALDSIKLESGMLEHHDRIELMTALVRVGWRDVE